MDGKKLEHRRLSRMSKKDPAGKNSDTAIRARHYGSRASADAGRFCRAHRSQKKRLNNAMVGYPLSIELAMKIKRAVPGMTRDWLYDGDEGALPVSLRDALREVETRLRAGLARSGATKKRSTTSMARRSTKSAS